VGCERLVKADEVRAVDDGAFRNIGDPCATAAAPEAGRRRHEDGGLGLDRRGADGNRLHDHSGGARAAFPF